MDFNRHISRYSGQSLLWAASPAREYLRGQCVQQICFYTTDNGKPMAWADAKDWWKHPALTGAFDFITNNPSDLKQIPPRGAVMIWSGNLPNSGGAGHIAIFDAVVSPGVFRSFDSNWGGKTCHFVTHNWDYIIGWMVPKVSAPVPAPQPSGGLIMDTRDKVLRQYRTLRGYARNVTDGEITGWLNGGYDAFNIKADAEIKAIDAEEKNLRAQVASQTTIINQLNQRVTDITSQSNATKAEKDKALADIAALTAQLTTETDKLKEAQAEIERLKSQPIPPITDVPDESEVVKGWFSRLLDRIISLNKKG